MKDNNIELALEAIKYREQGMTDQEVARKMGLLTSKVRRLFFVYGKHQTYSEKSEIYCGLVEIGCPWREARHIVDVLENNGIKTLRELEQTDPYDVAMFRKMGPKGMYRLRDVINAKLYGGAE